MRRLLEIIGWRPVEGRYYWWPWIHTMTQYNGRHFMTDRGYALASAMYYSSWSEAAVMLTDSEALFWRLSGECPPLNRRRLGYFWEIVRGAFWRVGGWRI